MKRWKKIEWSVAEDGITFPTSVLTFPLPRFMESLLLRACIGTLNRVLPRTSLSPRERVAWRESRFLRGFSHVFRLPGKKVKENCSGIRQNTAVGVREKSQLPGRVKGNPNKGRVSSEPQAVKPKPRKAKVP
jgi:hypothetical protein